MEGFNGEGAIRCKLQSLPVVITSTQGTNCIFNPGHNRVTPHISNQGVMNKIPNHRTKSCSQSESRPPNKFRGTPIILIVQPEKCGGTINNQSVNTSFESIQ